ncbi:MAG: hypothetical protein K2L12_06415 [Clostridia bacterium]|nr:hypothetical protein [Clostridia bacterium]
MKLTMDNGAVTCSLDNKNSSFLFECTGMFDGFLNGKLKMYWDDPEEFYMPDAATVYNAERLEDMLRIANRYGIEVNEAVEAFNRKLQFRVAEIKARRAAEQECRKQWERLCKSGCGRCSDLAYDIDLPVCKKTGEVLEEKNFQKYIGGVLHLFNLEPFPSENCPFNIIEKQGAINERLSETCGSPVKA